MTDAHQTQRERAWRCEGVRIPEPRTRHAVTVAGVASPSLISGLARYVLLYVIGERGVWVGDGLYKIAKWGREN